MASCPLDSQAKTNLVRTTIKAVYKHGRAGAPTAYLPCSFFMADSNSARFRACHSRISGVGPPTMTGSSPLPQPVTEKVATSITTQQSCVIRFLILIFWRLVMAELVSKVLRNSDESPRETSDFCLARVNSSRVAYRANSPTISRLARVPIAPHTP